MMRRLFWRTLLIVRHGLAEAWREGDWTVAASANSVGSRFLRDNTANPQKLPAYVLLNVAASWDATARWTLQAGVNNLSDRYYIGDDLSAQDAGNAGAPRTWFARARYRF